MSRGGRYPRLVSSILSSEFHVSYPPKGGILFSDASTSNPVAYRIFTGSQQNNLAILRVCPLYLVAFENRIFVSNVPTRIPVPIIVILPGRPQISPWRPFKNMSHAMP